MVRNSSRILVLAILFVLSLVGSAARVSAQGIDITVFGGIAYPLYEERLTFRPSTPSLPGVDITAAIPPVLRAEGGPVFGTAVAFEAGIFGIEGRWDSLSAGIEFTGARYDLRGTAFPFQGLTATLIAQPGQFDTDRISMLSVNARIRTVSDETGGARRRPHLGKLSGQGGLRDQGDVSLPISPKTLRV